MEYRILTAISLDSCCVYLINVRSLIVITCDEKSNTVGPAIVALGSELHVAAQIGDHLRKSQSRIVSAKVQKNTVDV